MLAVKNLKNSTKFTPLLTASRGYKTRGKPAGEARSLAKRLEDDNPIDKEVTAKVNIGFPALRDSRSKKLTERMSHLKSLKSDLALEKKARNGELLIDLNAVIKDSETTTSPHQLRQIADHYGIFRDLFNDAFFVPRIALNINYESSEDTLVPVYNGNIITPTEAKNVPIVEFDGTVDPITRQKSTDSSLWTLVATNPDCHLEGGETEYVHWFVSNIPDGKVNNGETIVPYVQPFPPNGLGYQRVVFVLYKQNKKLDFSKYKVADGQFFKERNFNTRSFYEQFQDEITPAGLAFYQTTWDKNLTHFYHNTLDIKEPRYEYNFPSPYRADQRWFPLKQPFNLYMDKYRDEKEINKEFLEKKLAKTHPFNGPEPKLKYPNAHEYGKGTPSWLQVEIKKNRLGLGRHAKYVN